MITGGARGIGKAIGFHLGEKGYTIAVCDIDAPAGEETIRQLHKIGYEAEHFKIDVTNWKSVVEACDGVTHALGGIHVLINSAGVFRAGLVLDAPHEDWDYHFNVNGKGTFLCCKAVGQQMVRQGAGHIVNIASISAEKVRVKSALYGASKAAVAQFSRTLALELVRNNIRVHCICPGPTETEMVTELSGGDPNFREWIIKGKPEDFRGAIPLGRLCQPQDIANLIGFLISDEASFLTGQTYFVDGGQVIVG
jgi:2-hydroxycyclohexanecarboxyl-CoA dehydrogenase